MGILDALLGRTGVRYEVRHVGTSADILGYTVEQYYVPTEGLWYYNDNTAVGSVIEIADMEAQRLAFAKFIYEDALQIN